MCFQLQLPFQTIFKLINCITGYTHVRQCTQVINYLLNTYFLKSNLLRFYTVSLNDLFFDLHHM